MHEETRFFLPKVEKIVFKIKHGDRKEQISFLVPKNNLEETKNKISSVNSNTWITTRKNVNSYEFPFCQDRLTNKPISRAFFKMLEIIKDNGVDVSANSLHLAEAPGGFIESFIYCKQKKQIKNTKHYTFSIIGDKKTPMYNKKIVKDSSVVILSNKVNKGDIYSPDNIKLLIRELRNKNIMFITCDGGFADNNEFSEKEQLHHRLIYNQAVCSLFILEDTGCMVIKIFDIFTELTFDVIYVLSYLFKKICVHKPFTSRNTNSEKYIYCENFTKKKFTVDIQNFLRNLCVKNIENYKSFIDKRYVNKDFLQRIISVNGILSTRQITGIQNVLRGVRDDKTKTKAWIDKYY